jgi:hypothetical protein
MDLLRFTLVSEGSSDKCLIPILEWAIREQGVNAAQGQFAQWNWLPKKPKTIAGKILAGLDLYECDLLFVHRDADESDPSERRKEIAGAVIEANRQRSIIIPSVPVIPIYETEAWLLIEEQAIRRAANNPNGKCDLGLPTHKNIENCGNAKEELERALRAASERSPQRLKRFDIQTAKARVVDHISDFTLLRKLSAFQSLESDLAALCKRDWKSAPSNSQYLG